MPKSKGFILKGTIGDVVEKLDIMTRLEKEFPEDSWSTLATKAEAIFESRKAMETQEPPEPPELFINEWEPSY